MESKCTRVPVNVAGIVKRGDRFPVDYSELMPLDKSIHHKWKNSKNGGLYSVWNSRKPSRRNVGVFLNDVKTSWSSIPQPIYQNAIEGCRKSSKNATINAEVSACDIFIHEHHTRLFAKIFLNFFWLWKFESEIFEYCKLSEVSKQVSAVMPKYFLWKMSDLRHWKCVGTARLSAF